MPLFLALLLLVTVLVYAAGLDSRFIFDDIYNLQGLGDIENNGFPSYVFGNGFAGSGGRPISLLSFAMQYSSWPANPFAFKLVNLVLHLVNGILLFVISVHLATLAGLIRQRAGLFAILVVGFWLLHPIHVNTVLYTVQRMTQISAFFCLVGMLGYLHGRSSIEAGIFRAGLIWILLSVYGCTVLAILGKENGILLPLYILCIESILYCKKDKPASLRIGLQVLLSVPIVCFTAWFFTNYDSIRSGFNIREFTPIERVLTEFTVLLDYLKIVLLPHPAAFSLFHDGYPVSRGLLSPSFTLVSILLISAMVSVSIIFRKKYPLIALGVLLFFAGHLLEAGPLSLEIYFEHRNYFPSIGIFMVIASLLVTGIENKKYNKSIIAGTGLYFICLALITADEVYLWSKPEIQMVEWSYTRPDSERAKQELAGLYATQGKFSEAEKIYAQLTQKRGDDMYPVIHLIHLRTCRQNQPVLVQELEQILEKSGKPLRFNLGTTAALDFLILDVLQGKCAVLDIGYLEKILFTLINNPVSRMDPAILYEFLSSLAIIRGNLEQAVDYLRRSLTISFNVDRKLREIELLERLNLPEEKEFAMKELNNYLDNNLRANLAFKNVVNKL